MSNGPFDRILLNTREKVLSPDWNAEFSQQDRSILDTIAQLSTRRTSAANSFGLVTDGFVGDGFSVHATSPASLNVIVSAGLAFVANPYAVGARSNIGGISGVNALSALVPVYLSGSQSFTVPTAPSAGNARIDIIEVRADHLVGGATSRQVLDPATGAFVATSVNKLLSWDVFGRIGYVAAGGSSTEPLSYKQGTAATAGTEVEPSTTAGYVKIAAIRVAASVTTIEENKILDYRPLYAQSGQMTVSGRCRVYVSGGNWFIDNARISAPPGVDAAFTLRPVTPTILEDLSFVIRVGNAAAYEVQSVSISTEQDSANPTRMFQAQGTSLGTTTVDTTLQTQLVNATITSPVVAAAVGQVLHIETIAAGMLEQSGATPVTLNLSAAAGNVPTAANPAYISINVDLLRVA
jgi:hypothetical protein